MTTSSTIIESLKNAVILQDQDRIGKIFHTEAVLDMKYDTLMNALISGLDEARNKLGDRSSSVGDFLLSVEAVRHGLFCLNERISTHGESYKNKKRAVLGVATGEVHNLGIYIISGIMEALGYKVKCIEQDTNADLFLKELKENDATILGISSMMSTTLSGMQDIIIRCKREMPHVKIIVGGACMDEKMAVSMGADGYADTAVDLPETLKKLDSQPNYTHRYMEYENKIQVTEYLASGRGGKV